jgi:predicted GTPase
MSTTTINGLKVTSNARKVIFEVPHSDALAVFPADAKISEYGQNNSQPVIVVQNKTDGGSLQGADAQQGVVIMNEIPGDFAEVLLDMYDGTIASLELICKYAANNGYGDQYTTKKTFVDTKLSPAGRMVSKYTGIVKRDDRDVCILYRDNTGILQVMVKGEPRRIEDDIVLRTYKCADGSDIDLNAVPTVS